MTLQSERHVKLDNQCNDVRTKPTNRGRDPFTGINRACYRFILLQYRGKRFRVSLQPERQQLPKHAVTKFPKLASDCEFTHQNFEKFFGKPTALRVQRQGKIVFKFWNFSRRLHHSCVWSWNGARRRRQFSDNYLCVCYKFERLLSRGVAFPVTKRFSWCVGVQKRWVFLF